LVWWIRTVESIVAKLDGAPAGVNELFLTVSDEEKST